MFICEYLGQHDIGPKTKRCIHCAKTLQELHAEFLAAMRVAFPLKKINIPATLSLPSSWSKP